MSARGPADETAELQRAFETLVARVVLLDDRLVAVERAVEAVGSAKPPDPTSTLKAMAVKLEQLDGTTGMLKGAVGQFRDTLVAVEKRLGRIERRPDETLETERQKLRALHGIFEERLGNLALALNLARSQRSVVRRTVGLTALGLCLGAFLLVQFGQWLAPIRLKSEVAAMVAGGDTWAVGLDLLGETDRDSYELIISIYRSMLEQEEYMRRCQRAADEGGGEAVCQFPITFTPRDEEDMPSNGATAPGDGAANMATEGS